MQNPFPSRRVPRSLFPCRRTSKMYFFPTREFNFSPTFPPFYLPLDRSTILTRICAGWYQVAGEFKTLVHSFSRRRDRERERDRKIENTHKCTFIRDRGISSSSKIGNQCGFTDGAFVRDRQTRQSTTWYAVGDNAIILCGAQVRWCVALLAGRLLLRLLLLLLLLRFRFYDRPDYRLQSCVFFLFFFFSLFFFVQSIQPGYYHRYQR